MSIDWVPLINVPMHRRLELVAAGVQMLMLLFGQIICMATFVFLLVKNPIYFICICSVNVDAMILRWCKIRMREKLIIIIRHLRRRWHFIYFFFQFFCSWMATQSSEQRVQRIWCSCTTIDMLATMVAVAPGNATYFFSPFSYIFSFSSVLRTSRGRTISHLSFIFFFSFVCCSSSEWVRNWIIWKYFVNYFPVDLVKTVDLPADRHYLFAVFPHGVIGWVAILFGHRNYPQLIVVQFRWYF